MNTEKKGLRGFLGNKAALLAVCLVGFFVVFFGVMSWGIYKKGWEDGFTRAVSKIIPFPAARVGGAYLSYSDYLSKVDILKDYNKDFKNVDFNTQEGKDKLKEIKTTTLDLMVEEFVIGIEAKKMGVSISKEDLEKSFKDLLESNGGEEKIKENLDKYYNGMSIAEFKEQYRIKMLRAKLAEKVNSDESISADAKKKAQEILARVKNGDDFADLAKKHSQDTTAANGGDLGFFGKGKMVPEFEKVAFALEKGQVSEVVKTVYGYHIIKVDDKKGDEIKASHILFKAKDFNEWLKEKVADYKARRYVKI